MPETGAPQERLSALAVYLNDRGHDVTVLTAFPNYPRGKIFKGYKGFFAQETIDNVKIIRSAIYPSNSTRLIPRIFSYFSFVISSFIAGVRFIPRCDIIITESPPLFIGITGYILTNLFRSKWIFNVSDLWLDAAVDLGAISKGVSFRILKKFEAFCYNKSWLVTGQSKEIVNNINSQFSDIKTYRLSNGVDIDRFHPKNKSNILKKWLNGKNFSIVYAGLHGIAQGLDQVIELGCRLEKNNYDIQIILIGDGPEKEQLIKLAKDKGLGNITFVKSQNRKRMPSIWASADIALISLKTHIPGSVPSKLYEAMSSSVPIALIADGEAADIVKNSKCGKVVSPKAIDSLEKVIDLLYNNHKIRNEYGNNGRISVSKNFNRNFILKNFLNYLESNVNN